LKSRNTTGSVSHFTGSPVVSSLVVLDESSGPVVDVSSGPPVVVESTGFPVVSSESVLVFTVVSVVIVVIVVGAVVVVPDGSLSASMLSLPAVTLVSVAEPPSVGVLSLVESDTVLGTIVVVIVSVLPPVPALPSMSSPPQPSSTPAPSHAAATPFEPSIIVRIPEPTL